MHVIYILLKVLRMVIGVLLGVGIDKGPFFPDSVDTDGWLERQEFQAKPYRNLLQTYNSFLRPVHLLQIMTTFPFASLAPLTQREINRTKLVWGGLKIFEPWANSLLVYFGRGEPSSKDQRRANFRFFKTQRLDFESSCKPPIHESGISCYPAIAKQKTSELFLLLIAGCSCPCFGVLRIVLLLFVSLFLL